MARGLAFRILESGAAIDLRADDPPARITPEQREALKASGIRAGRVAVHAPDAQKPAAQRVIAILKAVASGTEYPLAPEGAGSFALDGTWPEEALAANGYLRFGRRAVRADLAERLGWEIAKRRKDAGKNAFAIAIDLASMVSCPADDWPGVLKGFGLAPAEKDKETGAVTLWRYGARSRPEEGQPSRPPRAERPQGERPQRDAAQGERPGRPPADRPEGKGPRGEGQGRDRNRSRGGDDRRPQRGNDNRGDNRGARRQENRPDNRPAPPPRKVADPDSPFAALAALLPPPKPPKPPRPPKQKKPREQSAEKSEPASGEAGFTYKPFE
jgi:ATP-dependent RNA helicase SUPV3L1/SUV3